MVVVVVVGHSAGRDAGMNRPVAAMRDRSFEFAKIIVVASPGPANHAAATIAHLAGGLCLYASIPSRKQFGQL
jgi:hypothetical protein